MWKTTSSSFNKRLPVCKRSNNKRNIKNSDSSKQVFIFQEDYLIEVTEKPKIEPKVKKCYPEFGRNVKYIPIVNIQEHLNKEKNHFEKRYKSKIVDQHIDEDVFQYIRFLGRGAYATVNMIRKLDDGLYYARKEMPKHVIFVNKRVAEVKNEKHILQSIRFPFTINLKHFYQDDINIYFVLPLMVGGELYNYMKKAGKFKEDLAKFILSQLVLALEYLHFLGLIHRDIKLENMLVDHVGYIKLADFGFSKYIKHDRTYTICGTAEYLAPEVLNQTGYGLAADWWSFGVLAYEICSGKTPFVADEYLKIFYLIMHNKYEMPKYFSYQFSSLITHLLEIDLTRRYGNLKDGVNDIKNHDFFKNVKWIELINRRLDSPLLELMSLPDKDYFEPQQRPEGFTEELRTKFDSVFDDF